MTKEKSVFLNIRIKGRTLEILNSVIERYGFESNAETIRFIINEYYNFVTKEKNILKAKTKSK